MLARVPDFQLGNDRKLPRQLVLVWDGLKWNPSLVHYVELCAIPESVWQNPLGFRLSLFIGDHDARQVVAPTGIHFRGICEGAGKEKTPSLTLPHRFEAMSHVKQFQG